MTLGAILYLLAAVLFFLAGAAPTALTNATTWGLFCLAMGLLLDDYDLSFRRRR